MCSVRHIIEGARPARTGRLVISLGGLLRIAVVGDSEEPQYRRQVRWVGANVPEQYVRQKTMPDPQRPDWSSFCFSVRPFKHTAAPN